MTTMTTEALILASFVVIILMWVARGVALVLELQAQDEEEEEEADAEREEALRLAWQEVDEVDAIEIQKRLPKATKVVADQKGHSVACPHCIQIASKLTNRELVERGGDPRIFPARSMAEPCHAPHGEIIRDYRLPLEPVYVMEEEQPVAWIESS